MTAVVAALVSAVGFGGATLLSLLGKSMGPRWRSYLVAIAAGILLALSFGDLFPEALELAGEGAVAAFLAGFALLFLAEAFTRSHTHHSPGEQVRAHSRGPFLYGLAIHNLADGFVLGMSASLSGAAVGAVGLGIFVHQMPVGISLAAVLAASGASRSRIGWAAVVLGLAIPLAAVLTVAFPIPGDQALGVLTGVAAGVMAYLAAGHLLPEAQADRPAGTAALGTPLLFVAALAVTTLGLFTVLGE